ncbi:MAG TPA: hypothetical protein K8V33_04995, partial [Corynebacterium urealyticum]|nr:hypothetical protein [Corynebacterium urealyticum]
ASIFDIFFFSIYPSLGFALETLLFCTSRSFVPLRGFSLSYIWRVDPIASQLLAETQRQPAGTLPPLEHHPCQPPRCLETVTDLPLPHLGNTLSLR